MQSGWQMQVVLLAKFFFYIKLTFSWCTLSGVRTRKWMA